MAGEKNLPNTAAEDTVFSNLGLSREELGLDQEGSGNEDFEQGGDRDTGSGNEGLEDSGFEQPESRTSHTTQQEDLRPLAPGSEVKADKHGNLIHTGTGRIVAKAGKEARLYQDVYKAKGQAQTLQGQLNDVNGRLRRAVEIGQGLHRELEATRAQMNAVKQFGLDQGEHLTALRLFKELRDNPKEALKNILTRAVTNGINVNELGLQGGVDSKSLVEMIKQEIGTAVNPLKERTEAERRAIAQRTEEDRRRGQIQQHVDGFFDQNPEAKQYLPVFSKTLEQFPDMTLGEIWSRIQLHFALNPQSRRNQNSSSRRSLPQGRGTPSGGGGDSGLAPVTDSYDAIVKDVMAKAGIG